MFETLFKYPFETFTRPGGRFVYLSRLPGELRLLFFAGSVALVWFFYRSVAAKVDKRQRWILVSLRVATYALVFFVLGMPALLTPDPRDRSFFTAVLVDTSRSMSIEDADTGARPDAGGKKLSRIEAARNVLLGDDGLLAWVEARSKLLVYEFDSGARRHERGSEFRAEGAYTNIFRSVRDMDSDLRALPLAAVVMLTDGCRTVGGAPPDASRLLAARGVPLHIVGLGDPVLRRDYEVVHVSAPRRVRRNTEVEVQMTLRATGFDRPFEVRITRDGNEILSEMIEPPSARGGGTDLVLVRVTFTPDHDGTATYAVEIPPDEAEMTPKNNVREFVLDIQDDRLPVLYIEGSPRMEYRFLRRAMFRDPDFRVVGMLRLASDRFYVQGANASEDYLRQGFPKTREQLFAFQAVILGDIEAGYFTSGRGGQLEMLKEFVQVRGGGLLMLGGVNSFGLGRYAGTPVGKMLPVVISGSAQGWGPPYSNQKYYPRATSEGLRHPVMRLSADPKVTSHMWEKAPPLIGITPVRGVKPGASLLIVKEDGRSPVLAVQNYGAGRVAAFTSGGSWYWQVSMPAGDEFHERFWKQLIRWLVMGAKQQLTVTTAGDIYGRGDPVIVRATVLGKDLRPLNDAEVIAALTDPFGNTEDIPMHWILSEEGVYECRYVPVDSGSYALSVRVESAGELEQAGWEDLKPAVTGFMVTEPLVEFSDSNLKEDLLRRMARMTGGRYYSYGEPDELLSGLKKELDKAIRRAKMEGTEVRTGSLWDMPVLYVLLIGLMGTEWVLRRRFGLA